jgi:murein peptide amidase A
MARQTEIPAHQRAHDYGWLQERWEVLAAREGWVMTRMVEADGFPVYSVESKPRGEESSGAVYVSAGIHGDEPAGTEALVTWARRRSAALRGTRFLFFPCLNPWGLQNNCRLNAAGLDLNRGYRRQDTPVITAQKALVGNRRFDAALMLHEDYDARGIYLYELPRARPFWGEKLLAAGARHVPREPRHMVEGRACRRGLIRTRVTPDTIPDHPEAFYMAFGPSRRSLTFETPSEFSLTSRVRAHCAVLDELLRLFRGG